jgi:hypothetical protein
MSEEDVRGGLRDAVADEPPLVLDTDALVATARQQTTRRRALIAVGAATVAVVVAAVAIPLALGRGTTTQVGTQPSSSTSAQPVRPETVPRKYGVEELRTRGREMAAHLREVVPVVLPEASRITVDEFGGEATGEFYDGQTNVNTAITFTMNGSRYSMVVSMWVPGTPEALLADLCPVEDPCQLLGMDDGGEVRTRTYNQGEKMITTVYHLRTSGAVVSVAGYNYDLTDDGTQDHPPVGPVTLDQLTALATDPELGL